MTDDLRALLRADLGAQQPPPMADVVGAAIRDGRRIRRNRRLGTLGAGLALTGLGAAVFVMIGYGGAAARSEPPVAARAAAADGRSAGTVPLVVATAQAAPGARTLAVQSGTHRVGGMPKKATSAAMLHLLTLLLPPGKTSHFGRSADDDLRVQLYLDDGAGPAMVRVSVGRTPPLAAGPGGEGSGGEGPGRGDIATVTVTHPPDDCLPGTSVTGTSVTAGWPDGTVVRVDAASCPASGGPPARPALSEEQAIRIAADPRWGVTMDPELIKAGAQRFASVPAVAGG